MSQDKMMKQEDKLSNEAIAKKLSVEFWQIEKIKEALDAKDEKLKRAWEENDKCLQEINTLQSKLEMAKEALKSIRSGMSGGIYELADTVEIAKETLAKLEEKE